MVDNSLNMSGETGEINNPKPPEVIEKKTSLLVKVREKLKSNQNVFFAGEASFGPLSGVDIFVAPTKAIYDAEKLNKFMYSLAPEIPFSARDEAYWSEKTLHVGKLYFDDVLGKKQREIVETVSSDIPEELQQAGINIGERKYQESEDIKRRTWVNVLPDVKVAKAAAEYERKAREPSSSEKKGEGIPKDPYLIPEDHYLKSMVTRDDIKRLNK